MADKSNSSNGAGAAPAVDDPAAVRNVVLVGPSGGGKTTLVDALLVASGVLSRPGCIADGTTVCDHDEAEIRQQRSVSLALASLSHDGVKVNLVDTPGYADFVGDRRAGLRAFRDRGQRGRRRADEVTVAGVQPSRDAAGRGDHQTRPRPRQLPECSHGGTECVRRQGFTALSPYRRRRDRSAVADALRVRER